MGLASPPLPTPPARRSVPVPATSYRHRCRRHSYGSSASPGRAVEPDPSLVSGPLPVIVLVIGEEAFLDVPEFGTGGKRRANVRYSVTRARKDA